MWPAVKAELIKVTTTRGAPGLLLGAAGVAALGAFSTITSGEAANLSGAMHDQQYYLLASINLGLFALIAGTRIFTDEFRYGSIVQTLLLTPNRPRVVATKAITGGAFGAALVGAAHAVMLGVALVLLQMREVDVRWTAQDVTASAGLVAAGALWGVLGVAIGAMVRNQVAAIVGGVVWVLVVENLGAGFLGDAAPYLPGQSAHALAHVSAIGGDLVEPATGLLLLATYAAVATLVAAVIMVRRDVAAA
jgi:ABC-2 type transport system permease protein